MTDDAPRTEPWPDRLVHGDRARYRSEYETARAARHALMIAKAPWWRRMLARLPDPQGPLKTWLAAEKTRRNRLNST